MKCNFPQCSREIERIGLFCMSHYKNQWKRIKRGNIKNMNDCPVKLPQYKMTDDTRKKLSEISKRLGKIPPSPKGRKATLETRERIASAKMGSKNPNWKGGTSPECKLIRQSTEYTLWRKSVFERDNYTCQKYGVRGGVLHPHHILNFSSHPELRVAINNGITLSEKAHREFHQKYGKTNNNQEQLDEFLSEGDFNAYYRERMEGNIAKLKAELD